MWYLINGALFLIFLFNAVSEGEVITPAAICLESIRYKRLYILALHKSLLDDEPGLFD
ncbi:hypothetical protein QWI17_10020 [Gilvimarinus sp. SDUM040013]|uniref:Uncharacterized protein n=1 Tax=Gilvimarinus gilvus TaxID=3058038 RepID=A0ABU4S1Y7_9GAMM|nr:hypothetical protein [Gilvimarinus sp. SDUM040013]MDO3386172.1 hypothetical protein [Gilvimarinus sp. SDUM040013]MDX6849833.1 hypothetical protein [Gilvimarinus sp. SDUM040013]